MYIESERNSNMKKQEFPLPDFDVCGADKDKLRYWNFINCQLNKLNKPISNQGNHVTKRYFGNIDINLENLLKPSDILIKKICLFENPKCKICPLKYNCFTFINNKISKESLTFADFFCGAGGLSLGFELSGLVPQIATDIDPWFMATYSYNRPNYEIEMDACDISEWLSNNQSRSEWNIDIVTGGVPCQSFSMANRQRINNDPRDKLFSSLLKAAALIKPKAILIENVSGMIKEYKGIISALSNLNFSAEFIIINTKDFEIPQNRKRLFFIAISKELYTDSARIVRSICNHILDHISESKITLRDAIEDLPALEASKRKNDTKYNDDITGKSFTMHSLKNSSEYVHKVNMHNELIPLFNHKARFNNNRDIEIFGRLKQGQNSLADEIKDIMPYAKRNNIFKDKYYKLEYDNYCKTITAHMRYDCNMYIHPFQARGLTAREAARVQSFPDNYVFLGNFQRLYQQIGNAVPPLLAKILGSAFKANL